MSISEQIKTIKENVPMVHQAGYEMGYSSGYSDGEQEEYDKFWDALQKNGTQKNYKYVFAGRTWNSDIFKPKYDIKPTDATNMFSEFGADTTNLTDIADILEKQGVSLDTRLTKSFSNFAPRAKIKRFPAIDTRSASSLMAIFQNSSIETIEELILKNEGTQSFSVAFSGATKLKNIVIIGVIGSNIDFRDNTLLTKASITSIINALSENLTATKNIQLSLTAVNKAFETSEGVNDGSTSQEWITLITPKSNTYNGMWNISLS